MPRLLQTEVSFLFDPATGEPQALVSHQAFARRVIRYDRTDLASVLLGDERLALMAILKKLHADAEGKVQAQLKGETASLEVDP